MVMQIEAWWWWYWYWWWWWRFWMGLRLPIPKQTAWRLTSAIAWKLIPIWIFPIWVQVFVDGLKRSTCKEKQDITSSVKEMNHNTSSLVTTGFLLKRPPLRPDQTPLGNNYSALNNTFERFTHQDEFAQELDQEHLACRTEFGDHKSTFLSSPRAKRSGQTEGPARWIGLDLLSGTGVATALRIVQWPTLFLG